MTQKNIDSKNLTIEKVFEDFYVIPDYQREYVWKEKQVLELLDDVKKEFPDSLLNIQADEYFLGSIVVCPTSDDSDKIYEVIDGQQRLTTSYVLFCVVKNYIKHLAESQPVEGIKRLIIAEYTNTQGQDTSQYKIDPQYPDSKNVLQQFSSDSFNIEDLENQANNKTESEINLIVAYRTIENFISNNFDDEHQIRRFYAHFIKKIKLVRVETADIHHALRVFETINNRGVGLDSMDLLKNLLFKQVSKEEFQTISNKWKDIKNQLDIVQEKPMNFLRYFILSQYDVDRDNVQSNEYQWLQDNNATCRYQEQPLIFVDKVLAVAKAYASLVTQKNIDGSNNQSLINIKYLIPNAKQHIILLLAATKLSNASFNILSVEIENLLFLYTFLDKKINELEKPFISWALEIAKISQGNDETERLQDFLKNSIKLMKEGFKEEFEQKLSNLTQLNFNSIKLSSKPSQNANRKIKYILGKLTQYLQILAYPDNIEYKDLKTFTQSSVEIEHILSQTPDSETVLAFDKQNEIKNYIYRLGNLALLEKSLNGSLQNSDFDIKKNVYSHSNFLLTKAISEKPSIGLNTAINRAVKNINSFDKWDSKSIDDRQQQLTELAMEIWYAKISIADNEFMNSEKVNDEES